MHGNSPVALNNRLNNKTDSPTNPSGPTSFKAILSAKIEELPWAMLANGPAWTNTGVPWRGKTPRQLGSRQRSHITQTLLHASRPASLPFHTNPPVTSTTGWQWLRHFEIKVNNRPMTIYGHKATFNMAISQALNPTLLQGMCLLLSLINCESLWIKASAKCNVKCTNVNKNTT